jgi:hypothetical protein
MIKTIVLLAPLMLASCQTPAQSTECRGSAFGLNASRWQANAADLRACATQNRSAARSLQT